MLSKVVYKPWDPLRIEATVSAWNGRVGRGDRPPLDQPLETHALYGNRPWFHMIRKPVVRCQCRNTSEKILATQSLFGSRTWWMGQCLYLSVPVVPKNGCISCTADPHREQPSSRDCKVSCKFHSRYPKRGNLLILRNLQIPLIANFWPFDLLPPVMNCIRQMGSLQAALHEFTFQLRHTNYTMQHYDECFIWLMTVHD